MNTYHKIAEGNLKFRENEETLNMNSGSGQLLLLTTRLQEQRPNFSVPLP